VSITRRFAAVTLVVSVLALPSLAAPSRDDPWTDFTRSVVRIAKSVKRFFVPVRNDDLNPPHP
jgi:hypothetical protein